METIIQKLKQKKEPKKKEEVILRLGKVEKREEEGKDNISIEKNIDKISQERKEEEGKNDTDELEEQIEKEPKKLEKVKILDRTDVGFDRKALLQRMRMKGYIVQQKDGEKEDKKLADERKDEEKEDRKLADEEETSITIVPKKKIKKKGKKKLIIGEEKKDLKNIKDVSDLREKVKQIKQVKPREKRITKKLDKVTISEAPIESLVIGDETISNRIQKLSPKQIKASSYYMNNREIFIQFITSLLMPYRDELIEDKTNISCDNNSGDGFSLLTHQKIVRDYINLYTPYRGTLLYHGLGSGKTCSSIVIAEGLKTEQQIIVMTPASLQQNYREELSFCGDKLYKTNQYWEFVSVNGKPDLVKPLSTILNLKEEYIRNKKGAWLVNMKKPANYNSLSNEEKENVKDQIKKMIENKYKFLNYNGLRMKKYMELTSGGTKNIFSNRVVVIDEVHNFISRIVNKLRSPNSLSIKLYEDLMEAENCRIVLLTGTPIINYPNEIGVLFNILRGYIKTWNFKLDIQTTRKIDEKVLEKMFAKYAILDTIQYDSRKKVMSVTKNPLGFVNRIVKGEYKGVRADTRGKISDEKFERFIVNTLKKNDINIISDGNNIRLYKALPDDLDTFRRYFINDDGSIKNINNFKKRILGLTSYLSDMDALLPKYNEKDDFHEISIPMSDYQFGVYEQARQAERKQETNNAKKRKQSGNRGGDIYGDTSSTYRIFSRAFCNFVFPPELNRPMPKDKEGISEGIDKMDEDIFDAKDTKEILNNPDGRYTLDDREKVEELDDEVTDNSYEKRLKRALKFLSDNEDKYLSKKGLMNYSPKFLNVLENIEDTMEDEEKDGTHLIYSQFRTLEGIGIMKLVLEANGFAEFRIAKDDTGNWYINMSDEDKGKPTFVLYTGTETAEEKEIIRKIFNSTWSGVPSSIVNELKTISKNNYYGEIVKIIMITASGAEGISLKNVRHVHIIEPYWHPVRTEQVIGRARRICSHQDLPLEKRNISVYMYLMTFTDEQKSGDKSIELRLKDTGKIDKKTPLTSDEALYEISNIKHDITKQLLKGVKESAFDCALHNRSDSKEKLICYNVGVVGPDKLSFSGSYENMRSTSDRVEQLNKEKVKWTGLSFTLRGKKYILKKGSDEVYDYESFQFAKENAGSAPILIGKLVRDGKKARIEKI